jgi:hypothetical protein
MLGEGRRWWITASSDSHRHYTEGGSDFWPGEYAKTYVLARKSPDDILEGLRSGRVFVTTGDLVSSVDLEVRPVARGATAAGIGGEVTVARGQDVRITLRVRDPAGENFGGRSPEVKRIDLIRGDLTGAPSSRAADQNPTAHVERRFTSADWVREGEVITLQDIFLFDYSAGVDENGRFLGQLKATGVRPKFAEKLVDQGIHLGPEVFSPDGTN